MNCRIERYRPELKEEWDVFVSNAKNATFLFRRNYMDYHSDRFEDFSLIARNEKGNIVAILPANRRDAVLESHGGLTYGGWVGGYKGFDILALMSIQNEAECFLRNHGINEILYKAIPYIYTEIPAEEDRYMLFRRRASLVGSQISSAINLATPGGLDKSQRRKCKIAVGEGITVEESIDFATYWGILSDLLQERYSTAPVHTLAEIELLHSRFPDNIKLFLARRAGQTLGGVVMYLSSGVAHVQYIAATQQGKDANALVVLFDYLIELYRREGYRWFDFGISTERQGSYLNEGLIRQKISLGGRGVVYEIFKINLNQSGETSPFNEPFSTDVLTSSVK